MVLPEYCANGDTTIEATELAVQRITEKEVSSSSCSCSCSLILRLLLLFFHFSSQPRPMTISSSSSLMPTLVAME